MATQMMRLFRRAFGLVCAVLLANAQAASPTDATPMLPATGSGGSGSFRDNPIVYFVITDRFFDGNPANNGSYGRTREKDPAKDIGTFHGGDLAGITQKLKAGWFSDLGVNALWITAPYEQIHGWVVGGNKEFRHYAYHGYYALDYTRLDQNMGSGDELRDMVTTAHAKGIRVLFDVVMNHPGYGDIVSLSQYVGPKTDKKAGVLWNGYENAWLNDYHSYIDYNDPAWLNWWGPDWVRSGLRGYQEGGRDDLTMQLAYLPDFKTESSKAVDLPPFLKNKPDTAAKALPSATVRAYLVAWLSQWVSDYGIDGFRADTVKHVEPESWLALKDAGVKALSAWRAGHPGQSPDDAPFWMTGEYWGHGIARSKSFDAGFDNMINFDFQQRFKDVHGNAELDRLYADYSQVLAEPATHNVLSYVSSHDTELFSRSRTMEAGTALLLVPGGVQIFYGDETARPAGPASPGDKQQATRSDMNWISIDQTVLTHWQILGKFRARHVALARGVHVRLAEKPYTFSRVSASDKVIVALTREAGAVSVGTVFANGSRVRDAYTGQMAVVSDRQVEVTPHANGVVLLEAAP